MMEEKDHSLKVDALKSDIMDDVRELYSYADGGYDLVLRIERLVGDLCDLALDRSKWHLYVCIRDHLTPTMEEYSVGDTLVLKPSQITISKVLPCWRKATRKEVALFKSGKKEELKKLVQKKVEETRS